VPFDSIPNRWDDPPRQARADTIVNTFAIIAATASAILVFSAVAAATFHADQNLAPLKPDTRDTQQMVTD
jgi:hypothetical protein